MSDTRHFIKITLSFDRPDRVARAKVHWTFALLCLPVSIAMTVNNVVDDDHHHHYSSHTLPHRCRMINLCNSQYPYPHSHCSRDNMY